MNLMFWEMHKFQYFKYLRLNLSLKCVQNDFHWIGRSSHETRSLGFEYFTQLNDVLEETECRSDAGCKTFFGTFKYISNKSAEYIYRKNYCVLRSINISAIKANYITHHENHNSGFYTSSTTYSFRATQQTHLLSPTQSSLSPVNAAGSLWQRKHACTLQHLRHQSKLVWVRSISCCLSTIWCWLKIFKRCADSTRSARCQRDERGSTTTLLSGL